MIHSQVNKSTWFEDAPAKLHEILHKLHGRISEDDVEHIFVYVGLYAMRESLEAASRIAEAGKKVTLVACYCDSKAKQTTAETLGVPLIWADCGGLDKLGEIAAELIG